jgi:site-specific recombinase XerD
LAEPHAGADAPIAIATAGVLEPAITQAMSSAAGYALAEKAAATRLAYRGDVKDFVKWCGSVDAEAIPATAATVAAYLAHLADRKRSVSTIQRRAAAIAYAHKLGGYDSPVSAEPVRAVLRGIRRTLGVAPRPKSPATAPIVAKMIKRIPANLAGLRDKGILLLDFAAALRRSELVELDVEDIERVDGGIIVHLGKSKTDQEGRGAQIPIPRGAKLQVIEALDAWLCAADLREGPLFRRIGKGGRLTADRLTGQSVALIVKRWALAAKLDPKLFAGHSLRAGFVTSALEAGSDLLKVMDITRHREIATLKVYDRRAKAFKGHAGKSFL